MALPDLDMSGTSKHGTAHHRNDCAGPGLPESCPRRSTSSRFRAGRWGLDTGWPRGSSPQRIPNSDRFRMAFCRDRTGRPTSWHNGRVMAAIRQRTRISTAFPRARLLARGGRSRFDSGQDCLDRRSFSHVLKLLNAVHGISMAMPNAFPYQSLIPSPPPTGRSSTMYDIASFCCFTFDCPLSADAAQGASRSSRASSADTFSELDDGHQPLRSSGDNRCRSPRRAGLFATTARVADPTGAGYRYGRCFRVSPQGSPLDSSTFEEDQTCQATARWRRSGPRKLEIQNLDFPKLVDPRGKRCQHGVILKPVTTNICRSDLHNYHGRFVALEGMVLGRENTGQVVGAIGASGGGPDQYHPVVEAGAAAFAAAVEAGRQRP